VALAGTAEAVIYSEVGPSPFSIRMKVSPTAPVVLLPNADFGLLPLDDVDALSLGDDPYPGEFSPIGPRLDVFAVSRGSRGTMPGGALTARALLGLPVERDIYRESHVNYNEILIPGLIPDGELDGFDAGNLVEELNPIQNQWVYFSLTATSPTLLLRGWSPADVLMVQYKNPATLRRYAAAADFGNPAEVDALSIKDPVKDGAPYDPTQDMLIYSVAPTDGFVHHYGYSAPPGNVAHRHTLFGINDPAILAPDNMTALEHIFYRRLIRRLPVKGIGSANNASIVIYSDGVVMHLSPPTPDNQKGHAFAKVASRNHSPGPGDHALESGAKGDPAGERIGFDRFVLALTTAGKSLADVKLRWTPGSLGPDTRGDNARWGDPAAGNWWYDPVTDVELLRYSGSTASVWVDETKIAEYPLFGDIWIRVPHSAPPPGSRLVMQDAGQVRAWTDAQFPRLAPGLLPPYNFIGQAFVDCHGGFPGRLRLEGLQGPDQPDFNPDDPARQGMYVDVNAGSIEVAEGADDEAARLWIDRERGAVVNDGRAVNPGDDILIRLPLRNYGATAASAVWARVYPQGTLGKDGGMTDNTAYYGNIPAGAANVPALVGDVLAGKVGTDVAPGTDIRFLAVISYDDGKFAQDEFVVRVAGAASKLAFISQPQGPYQAGAVINAIPQVAVQDLSGQTLTSTAMQITMQIKPGTGTPGATLSRPGGLTVTTTDGVATFDNMTINRAGVGYRLLAVGPGLSPVESAAFDITSGAATRLAFAVSPLNSATGAPLFPLPVVQMRDDLGNLVTAGNAAVTVAIKTGTGDPAATLGGTTTRNAVNGVAVFDDLTIGTVGNGYQLTAASPGLTGAESGAFNVASVPRLTVVKTATPATVEAGQEITYTLTYGNVSLTNATSVVLTDAIPLGTTYVEGSATGGAVFNNGVLLWNLGAVAAGVTNQQVSFRVLVNANMTGGGMIRNLLYAIACAEAAPVVGSPVQTAVGDHEAPTTRGHVPAKGSTRAPRNTVIAVTITDTGSGVKHDGGTVTIRVEGDVVYDGANETSTGVYDSRNMSQTVKGVCRRVGMPNAYTFIFQPSTPFGQQQTVDVQVTASDVAGNIMAPDVYSFTTIPRPFGPNHKVNSDTGALAQDHADAVVDAQGNVWVVWDQTTAAGDTDIYIGKLAAGTKTFGASTVVYAGAGNQLRPSIAATSGGKLYVAWEDNRNGNWDIFFSCSADGTTWTAAAPVCDAVGDQTLPDVLVNPTGNVYVAWQDGRAGAGNADIWGAMSDDEGATWQTVQITNDTTDQTQPRGCVDGNGQVFVVWTDSRNGNTDIYGATDNGQGGFTEVALVNSASNQTRPVIVAESSGSVLHLAWVDDRASVTDIYYKKGAGLAALAAAAEEVVTDDGNNTPVGEPNYNQVAPALAVSGTGDSAKAFCVWQDHRNVTPARPNDTDIYYAETGSPFGVNVLLNDDRRNAAQSLPALVLYQGNPLAFWTDDRRGNKDIYGVGAVMLGDALATGLIGSGGGTVEVEGGLPGVPDSLNDVTLTIPANALTGEIELTIRPLDNAPPPPTGGFGVMYEFEPSGLTFDAAVTICIPVTDAEIAGMTTFTVYWYDPATDSWSAEGITNVQLVTGPGGVKYLQFQVTHFTTFSLSGGAAAAGGGGGGGGGGGCSTSRGGPGDTLLLLLPLLVAAVAVGRRLHKGTR
jgi:uncharacterized repeat protein (TIGR01451 family)